jgi:hypothetical protein
MRRGANTFRKRNIKQAPLETIIENELLLNAWNVTYFEYDLEDGNCVVERYCREATATQDHIELLKFSRAYKKYM